MRAYGLDLSPAMHRITSRKMRKRGVWVPLVLGEAQRMPFADGGFDTVLSTFPAGYILSPDTLREVARLLRCPNPTAGFEGGRFVIVGLFFETDNTILRCAARFVYGKPGGDVLGEYEQLGRAAGLEVTVIPDEARWLRMPVIVLERRDAGNGVASHSSADTGHDKLSCDAQKGHGRGARA